MKTTYRTHTCGELRSEHDGTTIKLTGWVDRRRDYGALVFIDIRDRYGKTQIVFDEEAKELTGDAQKLRHEDVVQVEGVVRSRDDANKNPKIATGDIEVHVRALTVLNRSETPPFEVNSTAKEGDDVAMELRFKHRPLDLRRPAMQERLIFRHKLIKALRDHLDSVGFLDIETPILTTATPEGARDYLVPSRVTKGSFYALPQSP
ncbi:MAG: amino acid--tRNA ligase-related protein, partial [Planctomycetota bacterium]